MLGEFRPARIVLLSSKHIVVYLDDLQQFEAIDIDADTSPDGTLFKCSHGGADVTVIFQFEGSL